eukprot:1667885-Rhodomonas_salina.2
MPLGRHHGTQTQQLSPWHGRFGPLRRSPRAIQCNFPPQRGFCQHQNAKTDHRAFKQLGKLLFDAVDGGGMNPGLSSFWARQGQLPCDTAVNVPFVPRMNTANVVQTALQQCKWEHVYPG